MKPSKILERLEKARQLIAILPESTDILGVQVDGLDVTGRERLDSIHLATPFQHLAEANVIGDGTWTTVDDPKRPFLEESILTGGFSLFYLKERESAAPSDATTGDGTA